MQTPDLTIHDLTVTDQMTRVGNAKLNKDGLKV